MSGTPHPPFGIPWAAKGEERPSRFRTPIAYAPGHDGGVLFVVHGIGHERWMRMSEWNAWAEETDAAPVEQEKPAVEKPWDEGADGAI